METVIPRCRQRAKGDIEIFLTHFPPVYALRVRSYDFSGARADFRGAYADRGALTTQPPRLIHPTSGRTVALHARARFPGGFPTRWDPFAFLGRWLKGRD